MDVRQTVKEQHLQQQLLSDSHIAKCDSCGLIKVVRTTLYGNLIGGKRQGKRLCAGCYRDSVCFERRSHSQLDVGETMLKRDLENALSYGAGVREHASDHCAMCESPEDQGDRKHSERYHLQYQSDIYCAILAEEVIRLRAQIEAAHAEGYDASLNSE